MGTCVRHHHLYYLRGKRFCPAPRCLRTVCMSGRRIENMDPVLSNTDTFNEIGMFGFEFSGKLDNISDERNHCYSRSFECIKNIIIFKPVVMRQRGNHSLRSCSAHVAYLKFMIYSHGRSASGDLFLTAYGERELT